ncbi:hypothetical protein GPJ56_004824 [Histomonas meleagridis]|uniref:uncharacterized protein n=1 Tax=Histomonas meleagridis TaxID=135588 RepID=UPI00355A38CD|nr:hypothetical protein GPJ56_004824 [Histomonas meleagridis]KAH0803475.1 hypothetical protein GO595_003819 [Histomonas meleagridis]
MCRRLSEPPKSTQQETSSKKQTKRKSDSQIFERLYNSSEEKEKKIKELKREQEEQEIKEYVDTRPKSNKKSKEIFETKLIEYFNTICGEINEITFEDFLTLIKKLNLIPNNVNSLQNQPIIYEASKSWILRTNDDESIIYDGQKFKSSTIEAIQHANKGKQNKFELYVVQCLMESISQSKKKKTETEKNDKTVENKPMKQKTIKRLSKAKNPQKKHLLPKYKEHPKYISIGDEPPPVPPPEMTNKILHDSKLGNLPFEQREEELMKKRSYNMLKIEEEMYHFDEIKAKPAPKLSPKMQQKLDEYKMMKEEAKNKKELNRPNITSYEEYQNIKKTYDMANRPNGWNEHIERIRVSYQKNENMKKHNENDEL